MRKNQIITIIARKGSGKTALMTYLAFINPKSCFIFDPTNSLLPAKNRVFFDYETQDFKKFVNAIGRQIYRQKIEIVINKCDDIDEILEIIYNHLENVSIVIDEVDLCYSAMLSNKTYLYKLCNFGRHKQIDLIGVTRRPANTPRVLTSQSDYLILGCSNREPRDLEYLRNFITKDDLLRYTTLAPFEFLCYNTNANTSFEMKLPKEAIKYLNIN